MAKETIREAASAGGVDLTMIFKAAGPEDLAKLQERIKELTAELEGLRILERAVNVRVNGVQPKAVKKTKAQKAAAEPGRDDGLADRIFNFISKEGPATATSMSLMLGVSPQAVGIAARRSGWFRQDDYDKSWSILKRA